MAIEGRVLRPANENPWYVLMTIYGEQDGEGFDEALHSRNRAAWNAWACQGLTSERQRELTERTKIPLAELSAWAAIHTEVAERHLAAMRERNIEGFCYPGLPNVDDKIDLSNVEFVHRLSMRNTVFLKPASFQLAVFQKEIRFVSTIFTEAAIFNDAIFNDLVQFIFTTFCSDAQFNSSTFSWRARFSNANFKGEAGFEAVNFAEDAHFHSAIFSNPAWFGSATFGKDAWFSSARFCRDAGFDLVKFNGHASFDSRSFDGPALFSSAVFSKHANFGHANFSDDVKFDRAIFHGYAYFPKVQFGVSGENRVADFVDCQFAKPTNFRDAIFHSRYPDFAGAVLHEKTTFTANPDHWPKGEKSDPEQAKASCAVIRHNLGKQGLPEAEHFFFRREMGFAGQIGGWWERLPYRLFGAISEYGYSIARPASCLFWVWFLPTLIFAAFRMSGVPMSDIPEALWSGALSFANLFPVLGFHRVWFDADKLEMLSPWLKALSGAQTVVSLPLLFFLGLGLRTRFRMR